MGWTYICESCGAGAHALTVDDIANAHTGRTHCRCGEPNAYDTWENRTRILAQALLDIHKMVEKDKP